MPTEVSSTVPGVVRVIACKRSPPWMALGALPTVPGAVSVKFSARLGATPTPLNPLRSPVSVPVIPRTGAPAACAWASGAEREDAGSRVVARAQRGREGDARPGILHGRAGGVRGAQRAREGQARAVRP